MAAIGGSIDVITSYSIHYTKLYDALIERYEALASRNRGYIAEDDTAVINIHGVLTDKPDFSAMFYGGGNTVYSDIISALVDADNDPSVKNIRNNFV